MRNRTNDKDSFSLNTSITSQYDESSSFKPSSISALNNNDVTTPESPHLNADTNRKHEFTNSHPAIKTKSTKKHKTSMKHLNGFDANSPADENNLSFNSHANSSPSTYGYSTSSSSYNFQNHGFPNSEPPSLNDPASLSSGYSIQNILNFAVQQCGTSNGNASTDVNQSSLNNFSAAYSKNNIFFFYSIEILLS